MACDVTTGSARSVAFHSEVSEEFRDVLRYFEIHFEVRCFEMLRYSIYLPHHHPLLPARQRVVQFLSPSRRRAAASAVRSSPGVGWRMEGASSWRAAACEPSSSGAAGDKKGHRPAGDPRTRYRYTCWLPGYGRTLMVPVIIRRARVRAAICARGACAAPRAPRTVCKMIGFQGFWRFNAIYFSIGAFFVNILGG
eukprot:SAG31_NODE_1127_length_9758_cov_2.771301_1_plen_194_part_10